MNHILTFALIVFIIIFAIVLSKGTSFSRFLSDSALFVKRIFRKKPDDADDGRNARSRGTTGLSGRKENGGTGVSLTGRPAKEGTRVRISVSDHSGVLLGAKEVYIDDSPLLIGRGTDRTGFGSKLCLPDTSDDPTTSRIHGFLVSEDGSLRLQDCYDRESAFDDSGKQIHSVSKDHRTSKYIGDGFVIDSGKTAEVDIGDYILKIRNLTSHSSRNIPTFRKDKAGASPKGTAGKSILSVPTKRFIYRR